MILAFIGVLVLILTAVTGVLAFSNVKLWVELKAMKQSTHTLTYIDPLTQSFNKPSKEDEESFKVDDPFNNI